VSSTTRDDLHGGPAKSPTEARQIRVLVVDDEPEITDLLAFAFKAQGCEATQAHGGREAYNVATTAGIDVIVSDVRMPHGTGLELLERIRGLQGPRPVVFVMSGFADAPPDDVAQRGAAGFFAKPFDLDLLVRTVIGAVRTASPT
jgi:DNA-binding NtrC family response regulator